MAFTLGWREAVRIDWGTILLFGGGLALGDLMFSTGLARWIGEGLAGALNTNAMPVARIRVGKSSGSHTGIQEYWPRLKKPLIAATTRRSVKS